MRVLLNVEQLKHLVILVTFQSIAQQFPQNNETKTPKNFGRISPHSSALLASKFGQLNLFLNF